MEQVDAGLRGESHGPYDHPPMETASSWRRVSPPCQIRKRVHQRSRGQVTRRCRRRAPRRVRARARSSGAAAWPRSTSPRTSSTSARSRSSCSTPSSAAPSAPSASAARSRPPPGSITRTSCAVFDSGEIPARRDPRGSGSPCRSCAGESLRDRLAPRGAAPDRGSAPDRPRSGRARSHYAHDEGVVHRDIKPENILLSARRRHPRRRLRDRAGPRSAGGAAPHPDRPGGGHPGLHGAGAGHRRADGRRPRRPSTPSPPPATRCSPASRLSPGPPPPRSSRPASASRPRACAPRGPTCSPAARSGAPTSAGARAGGPVRLGSGVRAGARVGGRCPLLQRRIRRRTALAAVAVAGRSLLVAGGFLAWTRMRGPGGHLGPVRRPPRCSPCSRSRTWATPRTPTSPTG